PSPLPLVDEALLSRLARAVDATLLTAWATPGEVERVAEEACRFRVAAVCVLPYHARRVAGVVAGSGVAVAAAIAFPSGSAPPAVKAAEAAAAREEGAGELDLVVNLGAIRAGEWDVLAAEVRAVRAAAPGCLTKWIVEQDALTEAELRRAVAVIADSGGDYVKNATGYGPGGASVEGIRLLRSLAGTMGVKAAGGIRRRDLALALLDAGADRIGTSATAALLAPSAAAASTAPPSTVAAPAVPGPAGTSRY
ncbi:MAG TPA: deoxyribose-phosphate aldolase, partial [Candidatus Eisenbacteria bacterium]|nr:deoxyribose-phosphate aldolase [Candidatus Eisenbacteria bacterium]